VAGGAVGNSPDHQLGTLHTSESPAATTVIIELPPAPLLLPPRVVVARLPRRNVVSVGR
jgi:hypothetical protein